MRISAEADEAKTCARRKAAKRSTYYDAFDDLNDLNAVDGYDDYDGEHMTYYNARGNSGDDEKPDYRGKCTIC